MAKELTFLENFTSVTVTAWSLSRDEIPSQRGLSEREYFGGHVVGKQIKAAHTNWRKSWRNLGLREQNRKPTSPGHTQHSEGSHLVSIRLPRGNYFNPLSCFFWLLPHLSEK